MAIELCRDLNRKAAAEYVAHGITLEDVSVAAVYSAYDIAHRRFNADAFAAVEFLRTSADLMERQLLATTSVGNDR